MFLKQTTRRNFAKKNFFVTIHTIQHHILELKGGEANQEFNLRIKRSLCAANIP